MRSIIVSVLLIATIGLAIAPSASSAPTQSSSSSTCSSSTPCGWIVYQPFTKTTDYPVRSPCNCEDGSTCVRTSDDISISAYVYRCRSTEDSQGMEIFSDN